MAVDEDKPDMNTHTMTIISFNITRLLQLPHNCAVITNTHTHTQVSVLPVQWRKSKRCPFPSDGGPQPCSGSGNSGQLDRTAAMEIEDHNAWAKLSFTIYTCPYYNIVSCKGYIHVYVHVYTRYRHVHVCTPTCIYTMYMYTWHSYLQYVYTSIFSWKVIFNTSKRLLEIRVYNNRHNCIYIVHVHILW